MTKPNTPKTNRIKRSWIGGCWHTVPSEIRVDFYWRKFRLVKQTYHFLRTPFLKSWTPSEYWNGATGN